MGRFIEHAMKADSISMAYAEFNIGINDEGSMKIQTTPTS